MSGTGTSPTSRDVTSAGAKGAKSRHHALSSPNNRMLGRASSPAVAIAVGGRASQQRIMKVAKEFPRHCEPTGPAQSGWPDDRPAKQSSLSRMSYGLLRRCAPPNDDPMS
jgi:hypothetical protein